LVDKSSTQQLPKLMHQNYWNEPLSNDYIESQTWSIIKIPWRQLLFDKLTQFNEEAKVQESIYKHIIYNNNMTTNLSPIYKPKPNYKLNYPIYIR
jgi:hypothetical protein